MKLFKLLMLAVVKPARPVIAIKTRAPIAVIDAKCFFLGFPFYYRLPGTSAGLINRATLIKPGGFKQGLFVIFL